MSGGKKKKGAVVKIRLVSSAGTGVCYHTKKNARKKPEKLKLKKYDPVKRAHVEFEEKKISKASK